MSTKKLFDILPERGIAGISGDESVEIDGLFLDSRSVVQGGAFIAKKGIVTDGHQYIEKAIKQGAKVIFAERRRLDRPIEGVTFVFYEDAKQFIGELSHRYFNQPSLQMQLIGVTGTNGKSSTVTLLHQLFSNLGYKVGLLSTIENRIGNKVLESHYTTPDPVSLNHLLHQMMSAGCELVFMEVSSHAIDQGRISGLRFRGGVFTNITHDHLDYHNTFREYLEVKQSFFDRLEVNAFALTNVDDKNGKVMIQNTRAKKHFYALKSPCEFKSRILENTIEGMLMEINGTQVHCNLFGEFNGYNLTSVYAVASLLGCSHDEILVSLSSLRGVEGRFEKVSGNADGVTGIVDYAHTPDALEKVLATIKDIKSSGSKVITVVGCGGDRDKAKRPIMAKIAQRFSHIVILTSDNPRSENPEFILDDMMSGISDKERKQIIRIVDRNEAIKTACMMAGSRDIILVAGKGHEKYQEIKGEKYPFDDKKLLLKYLLQ